ncbi:MAG: NAD-dependent epimerase/dehydratase family protein, partial [Betaproteobacteria bacterium]|nr:NAD-dependent epimerase/dehydratase family protein [Betaproteobacteria bacterium]
MTVLVLGGAGFIGRAVVRALCAEHESVRVLDRHGAPADGLDAGVERWCAADLADGEALREMLAGCDAVVHLAAGASPARSEGAWASDAASQVLPAIGLLEAMHACGVRRLVFVSSGGTVTDVPPREPIREDHLSRLCRPTAGQSDGRAMPRIPATSGPARAGRCACPTRGEGQAGNRGQGVIATFVADALAGRPLRVLGDGSAVRDYVHVADVAAAVLAALHYRGEHRVFNVGSGIGHSIDEVVTALERALGTR